MDLMYFKLLHEADLFSGGIQNYLYRSENIGFPPCHISKLSEDVLLNIFVYLNAQDLCRAASVSLLWNQLSNDEVLWRKKINRDAYTWTKINSINNPLDYLSDNENFNIKESYLNCLCQIKKTTYYNFILNAVPSFIKNYMSWTRTPNFCLVGPSMDVGEMEIVKKIMTGGKKDLYSLVSLSRGNSMGFGGGFIIKMAQSRNCCLIPLFTSTKDKREHLTIEKRLSNNCLYERVHSADKLKMNTSASNFLSSVDGLIYILEDNFVQSQFEYFNDELELLADCIPINAPILIVILTLYDTSSDTSSWQTSCYHFVKCIDANKIHQPWQVSKCCVNNMDEFIEALDWLNKSHRRK